jgi:superfamily II DNA or RNA helicase
VGGEGVSLPDLERVIEVGFLYGSRREEAQLMGRLFHSAEEEPEHIILMTEAELEAYEKRLYAIYEKGFRINIVR